MIALCMFVIWISIGGFIFSMLLNLLKDTQPEMMATYERSHIVAGYVIGCLLGPLWILLLLSQAAKLSKKD